MSCSKVIIIHSSYLVRKGLLSYIQQFTKTEDIITHSYIQALQTLAPINNTLIIIDERFLTSLANKIHKLTRDKNIIIAISASSSLPGAALFHDVIFIDDTREMIHKKVSPYFTKSDHNDNHLTEREKEILRYVAKGNSNKEMASLLFISTHTVISHRKNISRKLGIKTVSGLTLYAHMHSMTD